MKNLLQSNDIQEILERIKKLTKDKKPLWGTMNSAQMLGHCSVGLKVSLGKIKPTSNIFMLTMGKILKNKILNADEFRKNTPTAKEYIMPADIDFDSAKSQLLEMVNYFASDNVENEISSQKHPFLGKLTPEEWGNLMYKHLDHHLRQFGL
ncbi:MAG: DUF1569 domain-containing protein [Ignavibacteria bacterium]|nr:DUF1569 domain-containing protein [Ignavibacteria bacterium]